MTRKEMKEIVRKGVEGTPKDIYLSCALAYMAGRFSKVSMGKCYEVFKELREEFEKECLDLMKGVSL